MINKNDINKISEAMENFGVFGDDEADSLDVPPISKDWFTKEWRLNNNNQSYRFKVRSIEYTDDRVMIRIIGEEPIDSDYPTSLMKENQILIIKEDIFMENNIRINIIVSANLSHYMYIQSYTSYELAERIGVDPATVRKWRSGKAVPRRANLIKLETILEIPDGRLSRLSKE